MNVVKCLNFEKIALGSLEKHENDTLAMFAVVAVIALIECSDVGVVLNVSSPSSSSSTGTVQFLPP